MIGTAERRWRQEQYSRLKDQFDNEVGLDEAMAKKLAERSGDRLDALREVQTFLDGGDPETFRSNLDQWSRNKGYFGFGGPAGAMFLNQLIAGSETSEIAELLRTSIRLPASLEDAVATLERLADHVAVIRSAGSNAAVGRVPYFLSWFWWLAEPDSWWVIWPNAEKGLALLGFLPASSTFTRQGERYRRFVEECAPLGPIPEVEEVLSWLGKHEPPLGVDPSLVERMQFAVDAPRRSTETDDPARLTEVLVSVGVAVTQLKHIGNVLRPDVEGMLGHTAKRRTPNLYWGDDLIRADAWVTWRPEIGSPTAQLNLVVSKDGVRVGLYPYLSSNGRGFTQIAYDAASAVATPGLDWVLFGSGQVSGPASQLLGRILEPAEAADPAKLRNAVLETARTLRPAFDAVIAAGLKRASSAESREPDDELDLTGLFRRFLAETGYPNDDDAAHEADRIQMAEALSHSSLPSLAPSTMRRIYNGSAYGSPGPQSILNTTLRDGGEDTYTRLLQAVDHLLWGESAPVEQRIRRVLDDDDLGVRGFKESVIMKLLAIAHPERFLPVYPYTGDKGKAAMLRQLGEELPPMGASPEERQIVSNDALRSITEPLLPGDPWGQKNFLYWLLEREDEQAPTIEAVDEDLLGDLADELNVDRAFLEDLEALLKQHRQIILFGPPGTGKTYVAMKLAEALAPDPSARTIVQFHPSTSYEDFFEGYRPDADSDGNLTYRLAPGPLRTMAEAASDSTKPHVLIIDEINRADLAKVLGELLFLLEYRGEEMTTLYRPDELFSLPENLWIIGTMNTADRSIALVDAALRRRFQFVPFVPDDREENPIAGLLRRWAGPEREWLADLVDAVNQRLRKDLGGTHLLLGPSYFMREPVDRVTLERIWSYQIEPLIDDVFFGEPEKIEPYRFEEVWRRHGPDSLLE